MKFFNIVLATSLILPLAQAAAHSSCSEVFNRHGWGYSYYPFEPSKDGSVKPVSGVNSFKFDKSTGTYTVEEKIEFQEPNSQKKQVNVIIHELKVDSNGNWISYESKDQNVKNEIATLKNQANQKSSKLVSFLNMVENKIFNVSRRIDFKMQSGSCVPVEGITNNILITAST